VNNNRCLPPCRVLRQPAPKRVSAAVLCAAGHHNFNFQSDVHATFLNNLCRNLTQSPINNPRRGGAGVIERAMAISGKARTLARSTLVIRPAALRSSSGLAAHSGLISKYISGGERPNRAISKPRVSQKTFEAANSTPDPRNSSHARKSANLSTNGGLLYQQWLEMEIVSHKPQPFATMLAPPATDQLPIQLVKEPLSFAESSDHTSQYRCLRCRCRRLYVLPVGDV